MHCSLTRVSKHNLPPSTSSRTGKSSGLKRGAQVSPIPDDLEQPPGPLQLSGEGKYVEVRRGEGTVRLSRVIRPVQPVHKLKESSCSSISSSRDGSPPMSSCCGYTLISLQRRGLLQPQASSPSSLPVHRVVGVHTCGRASGPGRGQHCKHHKGAARFEVWQVRQVVGEASTEGPHSPQPLQQAMLLHSCTSVHHLEQFFGLHETRQQLQVR